MSVTTQDQGTPGTLEAARMEATVSVTTQDQGTPGTLEAASMEAQLFPDMSDPSTSTIVFSTQESTQTVCIGRSRGHVFRFYF